MNNSTIHIGPALDEATGAIILIHGRGSSGSDIASLAEAIPAKDVAWLAPSASQGTWCPQRFMAPLDQNEPWLSQAIATIDQLVSQANAVGISKAPASRLNTPNTANGYCRARTPQ